MKVIVKRIERLNRTGTSKSGNAYTLDRTTVVADVPFSSTDGFGAKEMEYQYGDHTNFLDLEKYRGKLPLELDIELGTELNQYDQPVTVIKSINDIVKHDLKSSVVKS